MNVSHDRPLPHGLPSHMRPSPRCCAADQALKVREMAHLEREQQADGLQTLLAAVHVVAQKQIVGLGREATILKQPQKVRVLPVDITWAGSMSIN